MHQALIRGGLRANEGGGKVYLATGGQVAPSMEEHPVQRCSAQKRKRLEAQVDPLLGYQTLSKVGPGRERIVQQGEQQGDVQAQPPREHLPPSSIARPATGCATGGQTSWCTASVSCGCSQLPDLVHARRQWL